MSGHVDPYPACCLLWMGTELMQGSGKMLEPLLENQVPPAVRPQPFHDLWPCRVAELRPLTTTPPQPCPAWDQGARWCLVLSKVLN